MIRGFLGVFLAAAIAVAASVALVFGVTFGALFLPRGQETGDLVVSLAWAVLTAGILGLGALALLHRIFGGRIRRTPRGIRIDAAVWRASGRCPVCRTVGARRDLAWCDRCLTPHHDDCWRYLGKCAVFGCGGTEARAARGGP